MASEPIPDAIARLKWLDSVGGILQTILTRTVDRGGAMRGVKNFLHGTWLGHPLHPALTDVPVGAWTVAAALDTMAAVRPHEGLDAAADSAVAVGLVGAAASVVTGLNDWQHTDYGARRIGVVHGVLNVAATLLYGASLIERRRGARGVGRALGLLGYAVASGSAYLGGHLVYEERIGVDHTAGQEAPEGFVPVLSEADLPDRQLRRVHANGMPVLLARLGNRIYAVAETCTHLGGPLSEGRLEGDTVVCPWHGSRFSLEDAKVLDGPATFPLPCFETRIRNGQIEVKAVASCSPDRAAAVGTSAGAAERVAAGGT